MISLPRRSLRRWILPLKAGAALSVLVLNAMKILALFREF